VTGEAIGRLIDRLDNADIRWEGSYAGLLPTVEGAAARQLLAAGETAMPDLIAALDDESRFVVAHVLLTMLSGVEHDMLPWNGLVVELAADGAVRIDAGQRFVLARRWRDWARSVPRPRSLPPA
jgi:NADPH-dependent ferric siderophore reductase